MVEVIPGECITNVLHKNKCTWTLSAGWDGVQMWEEWKLTMDYAAVVIQAMVELMEEDEKEADEEVEVGEGSTIADLAPK